MDDPVDQVRPMHFGAMSERHEMLTCLSGSGFICLSLPPKRLERLSLPPLLPPSGTSQDPKGTAYHLTVDANGGKGHPVTTGISAHDRAYTARLLASEKTEEDDLTRPGHMVTLRYTPGGVRRRRGHTECAVGGSLQFLSSKLTRHHLLICSTQTCATLLDLLLPDSYASWCTPPIHQGVWQEETIVGGLPKNGGSRLSVSRIWLRGSSRTERDSCQRQQHKGEPRSCRSLLARLVEEGYRQRGPCMRL